MVLTQTPASHIKYGVPKQKSQPTLYSRCVMPRWHSRAPIGYVTEGAMKRLFFAVMMALWATTSLAATTVPSTVISWTSPGDDDNSGTATAYSARFSGTQPDVTNAAALAAWWSQATGIGGMPTPLVAGTAQSVTVAPGGGFLTGVPYYFILKTVDEAGNWSGPSNVLMKTFVAVDTVPPGPVTDLH